MCVLSVFYGMINFYFFGEYYIKIYKIKKKQQFGLKKRQNAY